MFTPKLTHVPLRINTYRAREQSLTQIQCVCVRLCSRARYVLIRSGTWVNLGVNIRFWVVFLHVL